MMNDLIPFDYEGTSIRTVAGSDGEPLFVLADLCKVLDIKNIKDTRDRLDDGVDQTYPIPDSLGRIQDTTVVNEQGMYQVVLRSDKPEAAAFRRWITGEVLPSIRRRGGYLTPEATEAALTDPDFIIRLATSLKEERAKTAALTQKIEADAPHTRFGRTIASSDGDLLVKQVADLITQGGYPLSQVALFKWLRAKGWLCSNKGSLWNAPTKWASEHGFARSTVLVVSTSHGDREKVTPKITAAGQEVLVDGFLTGRFTLEEKVA